MSPDAGLSLSPLPISSTVAPPLPTTLEMACPIVPVPITVMLVMAAPRSEAAPETTLAAPARGRPATPRRYGSEHGSNAGDVAPQAAEGALTPLGSHGSVRLGLRPVIPLGGQCRRRNSGVPRAHRPAQAPLLRSSASAAEVS